MLTIDDLAEKTEKGFVAVRDRLEGDLGAMPLEEAIGKLRDEIGAKRVR